MGSPSCLHVVQVEVGSKIFFKKTCSDSNDSSLFLSSLDRQKWRQWSGRLNWVTVFLLYKVFLLEPSKKISGITTRGSLSIYSRMV